MSGSVIPHLAPSRRQSTRCGMKKIHVHLMHGSAHLPSAPYWRGMWCRSVFARPTFAAAQRPAPTACPVLPHCPLISTLSEIGWPPEEGQCSTPQVDSTLKRLLPAGSQSLWLQGIPLRAAFPLTGIVGNNCSLPSCSGSWRYSTTHLIDTTVNTVGRRLIPWKAPVNQTSSPFSRSQQGSVNTLVIDHPLSAYGVTRRRHG